MMSSALNGFIRGAPRAISVTLLTRGNGFRTLQTSRLKPGNITKSPTSLDAKRRSFVTSSSIDSFARRPLRKSFRGFSHSAFSRKRNTYRRFDQEYRGEEEQGQAQQWPLQFLLQRLLQNRVVVTIVGLGGGFYLYNLETVEATGRRRFNCIPEEYERQLGEQNYRDILEEYKGRVLPMNHPYSIMVTRVMDRLIPYAPIHGANWEIHVIKDDKMMNAFVLPGGKVFVFTGILPIAQDENGLAAVLGHEIAHVVAHHPAERMSGSVIALIGIAAISLLFDVSGQLPSILMNMLYSLPNSRKQEAEADNIGLMIMSKACFPPEAAMYLWQRFAKAEKGAPPQFVSTHPSSYNRMEAIRGWLPKAESEYDSAGCDFSNRYLQGFNDAYHNNNWGGS